MYQDLTRVIVKKAHDNLFNNKTRETRSNKSLLSETSMVVSRQAIMYEFRRILALYNVLSALTYYSEINPTKDLDVNNLSVIIRNFIWQNTQTYDTSFNSWWVKDHTDCTYAIINILEHAGLFTQTICERKSIHGSLVGEIKYILPTHFDNLVLKYTKLPNICPPDPVTDYDLDRCLKNTLFGEIGITKSDRFKNMLNI